MAGERTRNGMQTNPQIKSRINPRWTDAKVARLGPGRHCLGDSLYVNVTPAGKRSWFYRFWFEGRSHDMGLGACDLRTIDEVRAAVLECRKLRYAGHNPIEERDTARDRVRVARAKRVPFRRCFAIYCEQKGAGWSPGYAKRMREAFAAYIDPVLGLIPVDQVDTQLVLQALEPIWQTKNATGAKLRGWLESVFDFAAARGWRSRGDNPAAWKDNLAAALARPSQVAPVKHQQALPWREVPEFFTALKARPSPTRRVLEFIALTVCRKHEALQLRWEQLDLVFNYVEMRYFV
jgi:hypothetical protein